MSNALRYLSVCSGIEAASVAWHPLGLEPAAFSEIEPFPRAVLAHHYPHVPLHGDFTTIRGDEYGPVHLLVGGTPCQDFSVAGLRKGLAGERGNLTLEFLRLAQRCRPRWLVWENVPGVLSQDGGRAFGAILGGMVELGYGFAYRVLDAQFVRVDGFGWAVPQRRRRVFVVGYLGDWRRAAAVLFEREGLSGHPAPRRSAGEGVAPTISARPTGGGGLGSDFDCDGGLVNTIGFRAKTGTVDPACGLSPTIDCGGGGGLGGALSVTYGGNNTRGPIEVATAVNAHGGPHGRQDFESETFVVAPPLTHNPYGDHESREGLLVAHALRAEGFDASEDGTGRGTPIVPVVAASLTRGAESAGKGGYAGRRQEDDTNLVAHPYTLAVRGRGDTHALEYRQDGTANAILTPNGGRAGIGVGAIADRWAVRRLTPLECERLQGFPDGYTDVPYRGKPAADGPRYKALGNSMAVNCMRWIGQRIEAVEAIPDGTIANVMEAAE